MPVLALVTIHGAVFPSSETAAGGNYNLHFLSAHFRRELVPDRRLFNASTLNYPIPPYSLRPLTAMSFYLPQAGFLWSDELVWSEIYGVYSTLSVYEKDIKDSQRQDDGREPPPYRLFLRDKFNRRYPWSFKPAGLDNSNAHLHPAITDGFLRENEVVFIQSGINNRYLGVQRRLQSVIDQELGVEFERAKDEFVRHRVGAFAEGTEDSIWILQYDPFSDNGFRLYNPAHRCHLASSFRTFPDYDGDRNNSTIVMQLDLELEVTCTSDANDSASRMYILEGMTSIQQTPTGRGTMLDHLRTSADVVTYFYYRGLSILQATYSLARFRALYAKTQDTTPPLLEFIRPAVTRVDDPAEYFCVFFVALYFLLCVHQRRQPHRTPKDGRKNHLPMLSLTDINYKSGVAFILIRLMWTRLLSKQMEYAPRLPVLISAILLLRLF
ncbi:hypothetical protein MferCBS31731_004114 [Microsporum ferrugineum]